MSLAKQVTCWCQAYAFPHRFHGGKCAADLDAICPSCGAVVGDELLGYHRIPPTFYLPPEWEVTIFDCPSCHFTGTL